jgi:hypothetical protein
MEMLVQQRAVIRQPEAEISLCSQSGPGIAVLLVAPSGITDISNNASHIIKQYWYRQFSHP